MSIQIQKYRQRQEPDWFRKVRETFGDLIYDTRVEVLGIDTYRKYTFNYDQETQRLTSILLDYYQKSFVKWK
ncbi:MAG: hypothetical protein ACPLY9_01505 [Nitrososphaerales archaeon]